MVDVPTLAGRRTAISHRDLDVFLWLPGAPFLLAHFSSVIDSRQTYCLGSGIGGLGLKLTDSPSDTEYTVIHYNQV